MPRGTLSSPTSLHDQWSASRGAVAGREANDILFMGAGDTDGGGWPAASATPSLGQGPHGTQGGVGPPCSVCMDHRINAFPGAVRSGGPDGHPHMYVGSFARQPRTRRKNQYNLTKAPRTKPTPPFFVCDFFLRQNSYNIHLL